MPRERVCEYGNCEVVLPTGSGITMNLRSGERPIFCCVEHAVLFLVRRADKPKLLDEIKKMIRIVK